MCFWDCYLLFARISWLFMYVGRLNLSEGSGNSERKGRRNARNKRGKHQRQWGWMPWASSAAGFALRIL